MHTQLKQHLVSALQAAQSYEDYYQLVMALALEGKTTGPNTSVDYITYTRLNASRMKRWEKTLKIPKIYLDRLQALKRPLLWLVLTESWCGDASPALPVMQKMAQANPLISLRIVLRDEHPVLMDHFLTHGAMSIPKLIQLEPESLDVLGTWGPRSTVATQMVDDFKAAHGSLTPLFREELQVWYNKDKGQSIMTDLAQLLALE